MRSQQSSATKIESTRDVDPMTEAEMQECHDIYRAKILICRVRGSHARVITAALGEYAEVHNMTLHAAALGILARGPTQYGPLELVI